MKKIFYSLTAVLLYACATTMSLQNAKADLPLAKIEKDKIICIVNVGDGVFNGKIYTGSGLSVLNSFTANLQMFASKAVTVDSKNYDEEAKQMNAAYVVKPVITHWEPRAASWSGRPTRVEISVSVFDVIQNKSVINTNLSVKGRSMTFVNQSAEALANELIKQFVKDITE
ncbi:MAG: DUF4823 domain-containing protein [Prevotellaceae bacterium]|nr:DUF4823 domain-containing protein [Prevotellaceae bacterium]